MSYDADEPVLVKDQVEQFRRECDPDCMEDCRNDPVIFDCEWECGCA